MLWHLGALLTFKATSETTGGRLWAKELLGERGMVSPVHRHTREDESFFVLGGEISVHIGDTVVQPAEGDFLWAPRGVPHAFCVKSAQARLLVVSTPAGFERFFFDTDEPAGTRTVPPATDGPPDLATAPRTARLRLPWCSGAGRPCSWCIGPGR